MDALEKDSLQSQNTEEKIPETFINQVNNEEDIVENPEETIAVDSIWSSEEDVAKEEKQTDEETVFTDLKDNIQVEQVDAEKEESGVPEVLEENTVAESNIEKAVSADLKDIQVKQQVDTEKKEGNGVPEVTEENTVVTSNIEDYILLSEEELVAKAKELLDDVADSYAKLKESLDVIKHNFYKKFKYRQEELKKAFLESGGVEEDFSETGDELENEFKSILNLYREKRNTEIQIIEKEKQSNLNIKNKILDELKNLLESPDDFGKKVPVFQKLQQDWKAVGQVPATEVANLWKNYQLYVETFYDNLKINNELRDYDFRKNLEAKTTLCEQTEKLAEEADIIAAFRKLQIFHDEWREIGPVSRENRESIWERFKAASTIINKKHHDYFDKLREGEAENLALKSVICEKIEAIDIDKLSTYKEWQDKTDEIVALQEEWKKIGFAPKKENIAIYERFRTVCDNFFQKKNNYYKAAKEVLIENLTKKIALCEKAEALKDNQNWKETADKMIQLQKDWKTIGTVPKKQSDIVWKRFVSACDYFFEQKEKNFKTQKEEQENNLKHKKELIAQINALETEKEQNESFKILKTLIVEWNEIGHVPFKEKDKLYKEYKTAIDAQFDRLNMDQASRRKDFFRANLEEMAEKGPQKLFGERKRLVRVYESLNSDIATYENNIGFFSGSSKNAEGMIKDMERKIAKLKEERDLVVEKIKMLEETTK